MLGKITPMIPIDLIACRASTRPLRVRAAQRSIMTAAKTMLSQNRLTHGGYMDFELFATRDEALAFVKGVETAIEMLDSDHLSVSAHPVVTSEGDWRVDYWSVSYISVYGL